MPHSPEKLLDALLVSTVRNVVQRKLVQHLLDARLLHGNAVHADCQLDFVRFLVAVALRLFDLLAELQPPNGVLDRFDAFGLVNRCGAQELVLDSGNEENW